MKEKRYKVELTQEQFLLLSEILHGYKDFNRGSEYYIRPVMELEADMAEQTNGVYFADTTYDIR